MKDQQCTKVAERGIQFVLINSYRASTVWYVEGTPSLF